MEVLGMVSVLMGVDYAVGMGMEMRVWLITDRAADAPEEVNQTECDQKPTRKVAAEALDPFEFINCNAKRDADQAQDD
jgi:hypothetical protein